MQEAAAEVNAEENSEENAEENAEENTEANAETNAEMNAEVNDEVIDDMNPEEKNAPIPPVIVEVDEVVDEDVPAEIVETIALDDSQPSSLMDVDSEVQKENLDIEILEVPDSGTVTPREQLEPDAVIEPDVINSEAEEAPIIEDVEMSNIPAETDKTEPDTEAVSEDELPTEAAAKVSFIYFLKFIPPLK